MTKKEEAHRFAPEAWVTVIGTGENVKVESWSAIAGAYRVRSRKSGLQFLGETALEELSAHPEAHLGKDWGRCKTVGCGAPLTPELDLCERCRAPVCICGRCQCVAKTSKSRAKRAKKRQGVA
jgi:hypothetical protein